MRHHRTAVIAGSVAAFSLIAFDVSPVHAAGGHGEAAGSCSLPGGYETAMEAGFHSLHGRRDRQEADGIQGM